MLWSEIRGPCSATMSRAFEAFVTEEKAVSSVDSCVEPTSKKLTRRRGWDGDLAWLTMAAHVVQAALPCLETDARWSDPLNGNRALTEYVGSVHWHADCTTPVKGEGPEGNVRERESFEREFHDPFFLGVSVTSSLNIVL